MPFTLRRCLVCLLLASAALAVTGRIACAQGKQPSVLFLIAMRTESPAGTVLGPLLEQNLKQTLNGNLDSYTEYMDPARFPEPGYLETFRTYFRSKYGGRRFDVIIAADRMAHDFLEQYRDSVFPGSPVVFFSSDPTDTAFPGATGLIVRLDFRRALETALQLQPDTERVVVVGGVSPYDKRYEAIARDQFAPLEGRRTFTYLTGLSVRELLGQVATLPPRSIVFYISLAEDAARQKFVPVDMVDRVSAVANAPVYSWITVAMGRGIVGGPILSMEMLARQLEALALRVMGGEDPAGIPVLDADIVVTQFDWRQLQRWHISESRLPPGSTILYRPATAWEQYKLFIITGGLLLALQTSLIAALLVVRTRRRRVVVALRESESRFRLMADTAPVLIWTATPDKRCDFFNRPWLEFTGRPLEQELGEGWSEGVHPDDLGPCMRAYTAAFDAREPFRIEYRLRRADGQYRWVFDTGVPRRGADGQFAGYIGSCIDIADRKEAEEALRETALRYALATAAGAVGVWDWNVDTGDFYIDPELKRILGFEDREIPNRVDAVLSRIHPDDVGAVKAQAKACLEGAAGEYHIEHRMMHKNGSARWFLARGSAVTPPHGVAHRIVGTASDVTELKRAEDAIRESDAVLQASHRVIEALAGRLIAAQEAERSRIARDLHDDVSQQLAGLSIALSSLKRRMGTTSGGEAVQSDVAALQQRTVALAENVRHISHDLHPGVLRHAGIVAALTGYCDEVRSQHPLNVTFQALGDFDSLDADAALCLFRVAQEALRNVVAHAAAGQAEVRLLRSALHAEITIADDGRGFDIVKARESKGGLGLISIGERVRLAGGTLSLVTESNKGTRVRVQIPTIRAPETDPNHAPRA